VVLYGTAAGAKQLILESENFKIYLTAVEAFAIYKNPVCGEALPPHSRVLDRTISAPAIRNNFLIVLY
jgi:hypothetical protein